MGHGHNQRDVSGALTTNFLLGHLNTASVASDALVAYTFVLTTVALIVLYRAEDFLAEKAIALGLVCAVVDGLRLEHLAVRLLKDFFGRCDSDGNLRKVTLYFIVFIKCHNFDIAL